MVKLYDSSHVWGKHFIGFDDLFNRMEKISQQTEKTQYPPYSVIKKDDKNYIISLAIAGFKKSDVQLEQKNNVLTITGRKSKDDENVEYLHRGIAVRNFERNFTLAEDVEIINATLEDGILEIQLYRDNKRNVRVIDIKDKIEYKSTPEQLHS